MSTKITFEHETQTQEQTYKIGDWFIDGSDLCQLVQTDHCMVNMINSSNGNRLDRSLSVMKVTDITKEVIDTLTMGREWQRVSVEITTKPHKG